MAELIKMPRLSDTMEEGTVATWFKKVGDTVKEGEILAEIETDKATMEVEAVDEGVLGKILVAHSTLFKKIREIKLYIVKRRDNFYYPSFLLHKTGFML